MTNDIGSTQLSEKDDRFFSEKRVVVTGGAGFVGSHLCERLVSVGAQVYCLDNFSAGKRRNIAFMQDMPNFHVVEKDVCDSDSEMEGLFEGTDTVFHNAASKKNICLHHPQKDLAVNAGGTLNLLELAKKHGVRKFVHASTGSVYGEPSQFPTDETHPLHPVSYYGVSKLAGERYVDVFHKLYGLDTTILRYFHVYGPRQESNEFGGVVSIFLRRLVNGEGPIVFGDGHQVRSFTWVKDIVEANIRSARLKEASGKVYNTASGIKVSINDVAERMTKMIDPSGRLRVLYGEPLIGDIMNFDIDNSQIIHDLGVEFNQDFWGTLELAIGNSAKFLGLDETRGAKVGSRDGVVG
jgi:nucleoside-diphosphate-sugar epimerase